MFGWLKKKICSARPRWCEVNAGPIRGTFLYIDPSYLPAWAEMVCGQYDRVIFDALAGNTDLSGKVIWDVGASFGYHSLVFSKYVGESGNIIAFEPNIHNVFRFRKHIEKNPEYGKRIILIQKALSDVNGAASFVVGKNVDSGGSCGSHLEKIIPPAKQDDYWSFNCDTIQSTTADTVVNTLEVGPPHVIKIDVEGAEELVLLGSREILKRIRPILVIEIHNVVQMYKVQKMINEYDYATQLLDEKGASLSRCHIMASPRKI